MRLRHSSASSSVTTIPDGSTPPTTSVSTDFLALTEKPVKRRTRWGQLAGMIVVAYLLFVAVVIIFTNDNFGWGVVGQYLFDTRILGGVGVMLQLTLYSMIIGLVLGLILAVMRMSENWLIRGVAGVYIWFFRGTPLLVQLLFWGFAGALFPQIMIGIPFLDPWLSFDTNQLISLFTAAVLGLGLNEAAYMAEIVRGGILAVPNGQAEASRAIGFSHASTLRHVVLPQAMKVIIPPVGNNVISMLKTTSLVSVIGVGDVLYSAQMIYARNLEQIPLLIVACFWYILFTTVLTFFQDRLERRDRKSVV